MELVIEPDIYSPSIDDYGKYVDKIPSFTIIKKGVMCPCGCRRDKIYNTAIMFSSHIKSKTHTKWMDSLNLNKQNYYVENIKLNETLQNQRLIIARLEKEVNNKNLTIDYLTNQLNKTINSNISNTINLLDFD